MLPPTLSLELVQIILDNIHDEKDLCAVSLTCHGLYALTTPLLYSNVTISKWHSADSQLFRFAQTMLNKPHLASFVKSFSGPLKPPSSLSDAFEPLQGWLQHIVNLKTLRITLPPTFDQYLSPDCPFLLESLHIGFYGGTEVVENFLIRQSDLFSLSIARFRPVGSRPLSPLACPNLKVLSGNIYTAKTFFPGRRVARFVWNYQYGESVSIPPTLLSDISEELNNLRSLSYNIADHAYPSHSMFKGALNPPSAFLNSLRFLEVQFMLPEDWIFVPTLPNLCALLVLVTPYEDVSTINQAARITELFSNCPTLQRVDVAGYMYPRPDTCFRWLRGKDEPISIPLAVAEKGRMEFLDDN